MKKINKKPMGILASLALMSACISGCGEARTVWEPLSDNTVKIAVLSDPVMDENFINTLKFAADDFKEKKGIEMDIAVYDNNYNHNGYYNTIFTNAKEIAADESIDTVIIRTRYDLNVFDFTADILNEAKKPFVCADYCLERTIAKSYEHMLVYAMNPYGLGTLTANYAVENNYKRIAFCRSDTEFETSILRDFNYSIAEMDAEVETNIMDTVIGPYSLGELRMAYKKWKKLGVDAVCICNGEVSNTEVARLLREIDPDIPIISNTRIEYEIDPEKNYSALDGIVVVGGYCPGYERNEEVFSAFKEKFGYEMTYDDMRAYDLASMLGENIVSGSETPAEFISNIKYGEGYNGLTGTVTFGEMGCLVPSGKEIMTFKDGKLQYLEGDNKNG